LKAADNALASCKTPRVNELTTSAPDTAEQVLYEGNPALLPSIAHWLLAILTVGLALIVFVVRSRGTHYRVTTQRVIVETGLLSKRLDQIDLYRIHDYVVERPIGQRLVGTGNLVLATVDRSTPAVRLAGLSTDVVQLYERLRAATEAEKRRRGVRVLDADRVG
jgi:uncharacterized membrane protein YdbT with pleckstrin-like domain